jgi:hypothetical protein
MGTLMDLRHWTTIRRLRLRFQPAGLGMVGRVAALTERGRGRVVAAKLTTREIALVCATTMFVRFRAR